MVGPMIQCSARDTLPQLAFVFLIMKEPPLTLCPSLGVFSPEGAWNCFNLKGARPRLEFLETGEEDGGHVPLPCKAVRPTRVAE